MRRESVKLFCLAVVLVGNTVLGGETERMTEQEAEKRFSELLKADWRETFSDSCAVDWKEKWTLDGLRARVTNTEGGMVFEAGPIHGDSSCHAVMWTKDSFAGDIKIEYDYTRIDCATGGGVNIIYVQATGIGEAPYDEDISRWKELREIPIMGIYLLNMNLLHISYAAFGSDAEKGQDYVRGRYYPITTGTKQRFEPTHFDTGLFKTGVKYHITVIKSGFDFMFKVEGDGKSKLFCWNYSDYPLVKEGRVGLRHMWTRTSRYANFKICTKQ